MSCALPRFNFQAYEAGRGDAALTEKRLNAVSNFPVIENSTAAEELAEIIIKLYTGSYV